MGLFQLPMLYFQDWYFNIIKNINDILLINYKINSLIK